MTFQTTNDVRYNTILLFGPPGPGKGMWGKILGMLPGFYHLSTGAMFRVLDLKSEISIQVTEMMRTGELATDDVAFDLLKQHLKKADLRGDFRPTRDVLLLDGFPRTAQQADMLKSAVDLKVILLLDAPDRHILVERLRQRAVLENCPDDADERTIRHRFKLYDTETPDILAHFSENLIESIDVSRPPPSLTPTGTTRFPPILVTKNCSINGHHIVPHAVMWTFTQQVDHIQPGDRLTVRTNCPGVLTWQLAGGETQTAELAPAGGIMAGVTRYHLTLGPFPPQVRELHFRFHCAHIGCDGQDICCEPRDYVVRTTLSPPGSRSFRP